MLTTDQAFSMMPPDQIKIKDGKVDCLEEWTLVDAQPKLTMYIQRADDSFVSKASDPILESDHITGSLEKVTLIIPPELRESYIGLFLLINPTVEDIVSLGFENYEITED